MIASEFGEGHRPLHSGALIACWPACCSSSRWSSTASPARWSMRAENRASATARCARDRGEGPRCERDDALRAPTISHRRRLIDRIARGVLLAAAVIALVPLVLVIYYLLTRGLGAWVGRLLHDRSDGQLPRRSRRHQERLLGTIMIVALASAIAIPSGSASRCTSSSTASAGASRTPCATSSTS